MDRAGGGRDSWDGTEGGNGLAGGGGGRPFRSGHHPKLQLFLSRPLVALLKKVNETSRFEAIHRCRRTEELTI